MLINTWESIVIVVTRDCNLDCCFCPVRKEKSYLLHQKLKDLIEFISFSVSKKVNNIKIKLQGGEPLLCWSTLSYLINKCFSPNIKFVITTNGHLLTAAKIKFLKENKDKLDLVISIDDQKWDMKNREGFFKKIKMLQKIDFLKDCAFNITISPFYHEELLNILKRLRSNGVEDFRFFPAFYMIWSKAKLKKLKSTFKKIVRITGDVIPSRFNLLNGKNKLLGYFLLRYSQISKIPLIGDNLMVDSNGDIFISDAFLLEMFSSWRKNFCIGNINDNSHWKKRVSYYKKNNHILVEKLRALQRIYYKTISPEILKINIELYNLFKVFSKDRLDYFCNMHGRGLKGCVKN